MSASAFRRRTNSAPQKLARGVKQSPASSTVLLASSGIPSLDDLLGGGIQLRTTLLVFNTDPHSAHTDLLQKYFIAQGLASDQTVHVFDTDAKGLVESCMWVPGATATSVPDDEDQNADVDEARVKIAWRYENMQKFKTTVSSQASDQEDYCRDFYLSSCVPRDTIEAFLVAGRLYLEDTCFADSQDTYDSVIRRVEDIVNASNNRNDSKDPRVVRLSIPAFSSPEWGELKPEKIMRFLLRLRALLRRSNSACAFITLPAHVCSEALVGQGWVDKLAWTSDACIELSSSSADPVTLSMLPNHHGLLKIHRLPTVQTLVPASDKFSTLRGLSATSSSISSGGGIGENNLAFKCTRKRFIIETFHLDVDGGVGERRTTPAVTSIAMQEGTSEKMASQHRSHEVLVHQPSVMIEMEHQDQAQQTVSLDPARPDEKSTTADDPRKGEGVKKPKKRVGFQMDKPDILDF